MSDYRDLIPIEKCARCGYCEFKSSLHVHHPDKNRDNNDPSNLIVLCSNCHQGLHHNIWKLEDIGIKTPENKRKCMKKRQTGDDLRRSISWLEEKKSDLERKIIELQSHYLEYDRLKNQVILDSKRQAAILRALSKLNYSEAQDVVLYILYGATENDIMLLSNEFDDKIIDKIMSSYSPNFGFLFASSKKSKEARERHERQAFENLGFGLR